MEKDIKQSGQKRSLFDRAKTLFIFKTRKRQILTLVLILVLGFLGWQTFRGSKQQIQYQTAKVERGTLVVSLSASGQVSSVNTENVTTSATGTIKNVFVKTGDFVNKGQTIAEIDLDLAGQERQAKAWADYLSAKNTLEGVLAKLNSLQSAMFKANQAFVNDKGTESPDTDDPKYIEEKADWLAAEANYKNQQTVIDQANISLNSAWLAYLQTSSSVMAPISGTLSDLSIAKGASISGSSSTTLTTLKIAGIKTNGTPIVVINLSEIDVPKVKLGNKVTLTFDAIPAKTFTGRVVGIDTLGIVTSGVTNYPILITMDTEEPGILPNMSLTANIITATKSNALLVPISAIQTEADQSFVRILKKGMPQGVLVETGISSDTQVEIISGLTEGEEIITGTVSVGTQGQQVTSPFSVRFGGMGGGGGAGAGALRPGGFSGSSQRTQR